MKTTLATLALDCSFGGLSLGLKAGSKVFSRQVAEARASDKMLPLLDDLLTEAKLKAAHISQILVTTGPGSFTGIRLGLAVAQGLKLVNPELTIHGVATMAALAQQVALEHKPKTAFTILLDAAGGQVYRQDFKASGQPLTKPVCEALDGLKKLQHFIAAQSALLAPFPTHATLTSVSPSILLVLATQPKLHLPAEPFYLKQLTYKQVV